jgi:hypothetical protein
MKSQTKTRTKLLEEIKSVIINPTIYKTLDYARLKESVIKNYLHQPLIKKLNELSKVKKGKKLIWESNKQDTLHNFILFGNGQRPDFEINVNGLNICVEIKKGSNASSLREGFGQGIIYSSRYDFCILVFIDTSNDKHILNSENCIKEQKIIKKLWKDFNIMFDIV